MFKTQVKQRVVRRVVLLQSFGHGTSTGELDENSAPNLACVCS